MRFFHWLAKTAGYELIPLQNELEKKVFRAMIDRKMPIDRLYIGEPLDDLGMFRRVTCTRWIGGERWGLVILWNNQSTPVTARGVTEAIVQLWDQFVPLSPYTMWIPSDKKWRMDDRGLTKGGQ